VKIKSLLRISDFLEFGKIFLNAIDSG